LKVAFLHAAPPPAGTTMFAVAVYPNPIIGAMYTAIFPPAAPISLQYNCIVVICPLHPLGKYLPLCSSNTEWCHPVGVPSFLNVLLNSSLLVFINGQSIGLEWSGWSG